MPPSLPAASALQIEKVAKELITLLLPAVFKRTVFGDFERSVGGDGFREWLEEIGVVDASGKRLVPYIPGMYRGLDRGGLEVLTRLLPKWMSEWEKQQSSVDLNVIIALQLSAQMDLRKWCALDSKKYLLHVSEGGAKRAGAPREHMLPACEPHHHPPPSPPHKPRAGNAIVSAATTIATTTLIASLTAT